MIRSLFAAGVLALCAACDPVYGVEGTVLASGGAPIASATVTKACPSGKKETARTDADGTFSFGGVGNSFEAGRCTLVVEAPGFSSRTVHTYDVCYHNTEDQPHLNWPCAPGKGVVTLTP